MAATIVNLSCLVKEAEPGQQQQHNSAHARILSQHRTAATALYHTHQPAQTQKTTACLHCFALGWSEHKAGSMVFKPLLQYMAQPTGTCMTNMCQDTRCLYSLVCELWLTRLQALVQQTCPGIIEVVVQLQQQQQQHPRRPVKSDWQAFGCAPISTTVAAWRTSIMYSQHHWKRKAAMRLHQLRGVQSTSTA